MIFAEIYYSMKYFSANSLGIQADKVLISPLFPCFPIIPLSSFCLAWQQAVNMAVIHVL